MLPVLAGSLLVGVDREGGRPRQHDSAGTEARVQRGDRAPCTVGVLEANDEVPVTKRRPGSERRHFDLEFDPAGLACWDLDGVDFDLIDEVLLTFDAGRRAQKAKYGGELFPADAAADPLGTLFRDFFQRDRDGNPKGIIVIDLENLG